MSRSAPVVLLVGALLAAVLVSGCGSSTGPSAAVIEVFGPWRDNDAERFREVLDGFEAQSGLAVRYTGTTSYASELRRRASEASLPDIAIVPQPGLVADLVGGDGAVPLGARTAAAVATHQSREVAALGRVSGVAVGVPVRLAVKSLVWYSPAALSLLDRDVPQSLGELTALTRAQRANGPPWCYTIEAFASTGYIVSDWLEELLLRFGGPDVYDAATRLELPLDGPEVRQALQWYADELLAPGAVAGGLSRVLTVSLDDAMDPMLSSEPGCLLHRQANSFRSQLPAGTSIGPRGEVDTFVLPDDTGGTPPLLIAGDMAVAFASSPRVRSLMTYLATPSSWKSWIDQGGYLSPFRDVGPPEYPDRFDAAVARTLRDAEVVRFDLSDAWPAAFGSGVVWDVLTRFTAGELTLDEALDALEAGRLDVVAERSGT